MFDEGYYDRADDLKVNKDDSAGSTLLVNSSFDCTLMVFSSSFMANLSVYFVEVSG